MTNRRTNRFAVCVANAGYEASLQRNKIYVVIEDDDAAGDGDIRILDESGEAYLYPSDWFIVIDVPDSVQQSVLQASS